MSNPIQPQITDYEGNELYNDMTVWEYSQTGKLYQMNDDNALADLLEALKDYYGIDEYTERIIDTVRDNRNAQYEAIPDFAFDDVVNQIEVKDLMEGY